MSSSSCSLNTSMSISAADSSILSQLQSEEELEIVRRALVKLAETESKNKSLGLSSKVTTILQTQNLMQSPDLNQQQEGLKLLLTQVLDVLKKEPQFMDVNGESSSSSTACSSTSSSSSKETSKK